MAAQADDSITSFFQKVLGNYGYGDSMDVDSDDSDDEGPESETAKSTATTDGLLAKGASQDISKSFRFGLKPFRIDAKRALEFELEHYRRQKEFVDYAHVNQKSLHGIDTVDELLKELPNTAPCPIVTNPNIIKDGQAVIHQYTRQNYYDLLLTLLLYSEDPPVDINIADQICGDTPLHIAVENENVKIVKLLLVFGADPLKKNGDGKTSVDMASTSPRLLNILQSVPPASRHEDAPPEMKTGERMLFLDGGGMRGLLEIEVLLEIERRTGRRIVELFDWIVGTSIGGVIALALVYADRTLEEVRQMLFRLREVFAGGSKFLGAKKRSDNLEKLLHAWFEDKRMDSRKSPDYPNVVILTVNKATNLVQRHCFNNCFDNPLSNELLWKVARYTTAAAPMYYEEVDNYIDGGFLANNPCQAAWTEIHKHLPPEKKLNTSLVVSLGSGIPKRTAMKELSYSNIQQMLELMVLLITSTEPTAEDFEIERARDGTPFFRFNPSDIGVKTLEVKASRLVDMMIATKQYLNQPEQRRQLEQVTQLLVE